MYTAPNKEAAERIAAALTTQRAGKPSVFGPGRTVTRVVADKYATPDGRCNDKDGLGRYDWGCVEKWTYDDRPELGEFGGAFLYLTDKMLAL